MKTQKTYFGIVKLLIVLACFWGFFYIISPMLVNAIPALKHYGEVQDFYEVHSGRMYYTDLNTSQLTEMYIDNSIKYSVGLQKAQNKPANQTSTLPIN
ncbi:hypothetical protein [Desulfovibrio litoralis]|uniref:Uncharacterized protein n=1 Tax=Desulfovibrio litoralis DSM 11393 TaxID=1121455 RepID=A0A1M7T1F9_9BACT|nr:hypothetical protein [Desulfovibrio litoralis]SHN64548.1 hypothetical protein SAMN02745728_01436 [Desulfovibrio litoralis DSM 11393]